MADLTDEAGEHTGREERVAGDEEIDEGEIYYPGMLADLHEQVSEYQEELFERDFFGVCEGGETATG